MMRGASDLIDKWKRERRDLIPALQLIQELVEYLGRWRGGIHSYHELCPSCRAGAEACSQIRRSQIRREIHSSPLTAVIETK